MESAAMMRMDVSMVEATMRSNNVAGLKNVNASIRNTSVQYSSDIVSTYFAKTAAPRLLMAGMACAMSSSRVT